MDSLSQLSLGAAVGEVILGKKIGNRAMVWGAVAGTIPDLDVVGNYFMTDLQGLLFHRGISHSILFSVIGALIFGRFVHWLYSSRHHNKIAIITKFVACLVILKVVSFLAGLFTDETYPFIIVSSVLIIGIFFRHIYIKYLNGTWLRPNVTVRSWQWMFFWAFITHILLDCFTLYGTQVFAPFSNYRVSWATVSVADPIYTTPLLIFLIIASRLRRDSVWRTRLNNLGLILSCSYLALTIVNKYRVDNQFDYELNEAGVDAYRYSTNATILNNILWTCTAESDDYFYVGEYSFYDEVPVDFYEIDKNHHLLKNLDTDPTIKSLRWFSDDYFCITQCEEGLLFNDLRFGVFKDNEGKPDGYIFTFLLTELEDGVYKMSKYDRVPKNADRNNYIKILYERIKGKHAT
tara:strand:+ start:1856 stop:3070 length:1215 start_codon:yes stop_codon:yes gene_type:complete